MKSGRAFIYIHVAVMAILICYVLFLVYAPLFVDGDIVSAATPFSVTETGFNENAALHLEFTTGRDNLEAVLTSELVCDNGLVILYNSGDIALCEGCNKLVKYYPLPSNMDNTCRIMGKLYYSPFTTIGPRLHLDWYSEEIFLGKE